MQLFKLQFSLSGDNGNGFTHMRVDPLFQRIRFDMFNHEVDARTVSCAANSCMSIIIYKEGKILCILSALALG